MNKNFAGGGNLQKLIQENELKNQQVAQQQAQYPNPPKTIEDQINAMPNSDKLSGVERWVYKKLPGVADSKLGKLLETFGNSPVGKALNVLDVFAEGAERTLGLASQLKNRQEGDQFDWADAWKAGSLYYDVSNLPTIGKDGLTLESDLPGAYALVEARKMMQNGATFEDVRDQLYNSMGALKIRAQLQDTIGHVALDPLNWIAGAIKPVSKLTAMRNLALSGKVDVAATEKIIQTLREAGKIEDAVKVENALADAQKAGKAMTWADKAAINIFGGINYGEEEASRLQKVFGSKFNPLALTPEAKTHELMDVAEKNIHAYLINNSDTPEEFLRNMESVAKGAVGNQWGHAALTPQGRAVQGMFNHADASVKALGKEWELYTEERKALDLLSSSLGKTSDDVYRLATNNPEELARLMQEAMQSGKIPADTSPALIKAISDIPSGVTSKEKFFANASALIEDSAAQMGVLRFGVDKQKFVTRLSNAVKKYETMAFIKINPGNLVRNALNNEVTMVARGLYGFPISSAKEYWQSEGKIIPAIFERGFNAAGDGVEKEFDFASKTINAAVNGTGEPDLLTKIGQTPDKLNLGPLDMSTKSQKIEATASLRASTSAYIEFGDQYWNPKTGFTSISKYLDDATIEQLNAIDPNLARTLDDVVQSSGGNMKKVKEALGRELEINSSSVMQAAEENLGFKLNDVLGPEMTAKLSDGLPKAIKEGKVEEFVNGLRTQMETHVDEMFNRHLENLPGMVSSYVQAGGPPQFSRIFSKAIDEMWAGNTEHAIRMSTINELLDYANKSGDYEKVGKLWSKIMSDGESHFGRIWRKMDAYENGMKEGARLAGIPYPAELSDGFKGMKNGWNDFFKFRNESYNAFFEAKKSGQLYEKTFEQLTKEVDSRFSAMVAKEDDFYRNIDDALAEMIPDKEVRNMYTRIRDEAAKVRQADRDATTKFYQDLRKADPGEQPNMWQQYWQDRQKRIADIRDVERRGSAAMQGDVQAMQQFATQTPGNAPNATTVRGMASQYGIATQTNNGARFDNRLRATLKKYGDFTPEDIVNSAQLPEEVKTSFVEYQKVSANLDKVTAETQGVLTPEAAAALKQAKAAEKEARKAYEETLKANNIDKKMINKLIKSKEPMNLDKLPLDKVKAAFEKRATEKAAGMKQAVDKYFIPDAEKLWPEQPPIETAISELNYGRSYAAMDNVVEEAIGQATVKSHKLAELPPEISKRVEKWVDNIQSESTMFESARIEYAKMRRDGALLNYNRRNNFDNFLGHIAPFAFWTTHSMANWAVWSLDYPAMLSSYARYEKLLNTAGLENKNLPARMKGHLRVNLPFAPSWMSDTFVNPMGVALPFDAWQQPWEQMQKSKFTMEGRAKQTLSDMLEKGVISDQQYQQAVDTQSGEAWDMAMGQAKEGGDNYDAMDFAQSMMTPHAPLLWAYNAMRGTPNDIGPLMPLSRTAKNVASMMGIDWNNSNWNVEGKVRQQLGLPAYDKWDDYRIARTISNFAGEGKYDLNELQDAMVLASQVENGQISSKEAAAKSPIYKAASIRAGQEFAGGSTGAALSLLGIPVKSYPEGEKKQKELQQQFYEAIKQRDAGNEDALAKFFKDNPEYEMKLALNKKPEERLKTFMIDNMWSRWNELPKLTQNEIKDQLGPTFADKFLNKDTQNYDAITPQQLQLWLKMTSGKNVGELSATESALTELNQLKLTDPATAWRVQSFYQMRNEDYPDWYDLQKKYYSLPEGKARDAFKRENPQLSDYWKSRRQWFDQNPDLVKYITDDPKQIKKYENVKRNPQVAVPTADELRSQLSEPMIELIGDWKGGQNLPPDMENYLANIAKQYNISPRELVGIVTGQ